MARVLIVGCGCRGRAVASRLLARGYTVRGTTRDPSRTVEIEATGAQPFVGDPSQVGTLVAALDGVALVCLLLGSATGSPNDLAALHGSRLEMLLRRIVDTTVHAVAYEAVGSVIEPVLRHGAATVRDACALSRIPHVLLERSASDVGWAASTTEELEKLLA